MVILGEKEVQQVVVQLKDMNKHTQEVRKIQLLGTDLVPAVSAWLQFCRGLAVAMTMFLHHHRTCANVLRATLYVELFLGSGCRDARKESLTRYKTRWLMAQVRRT